MKPQKSNKPAHRPVQRDESGELAQVLRFTPAAWAKLYWFCHHGETEIGGFGITSPSDPLLVIDFVTVKQKTTCVSVIFDDVAVADFFEDQVDQGRKPGEFSRIWCHTHPGNSPFPSSTDEETFARVFGHCDWAVMFILACGGKTYARLRFNIGPRGEMLVPVLVDYSVAFEGSNHEAWKAEYDANVKPDPTDRMCWGLVESELDPESEVELLEQLEEPEWELDLEYESEVIP